MTRADLSEKRKAVIFQYKNNSAGFSKKQQFSRLARGLGKPRGKTYATQGYNVTNPNVQNLPLVGKNVPTVVEDGSGNFVTQDVFMGTTLVCAGANKISGLTTQNDTPGPTTTITIIQLFLLRIISFEEHTKEGQKNGLNMDQILVNQDFLSMLVIQEQNQE